MPLRTIARCLRGIACMLASTLGSIGLRKVTNRSCCGQSGSYNVAIAQFKMIDPQLARQFGRCCVQQAARVLIVHRSPAIHRERQRYERMPEQQALDLRQRQDAGDLAAALGKQVVRADARTRAR